MKYTVTIKYTGPIAELPDASMPICSLFKPAGSYVDSPAYEGTKYDANVPGWGTIPFGGGYAQTLALAMFRLAMINANADSAGTTVFEVSDHKEAAYFQLIGAALADQGFEVTLDDNVGGDAEGDVGGNAEGDAAGE